MAEKLHNEYGVPVLPLSVEAMSEKEVYSVLRESLYEFPVTEVKINMPDWIACLNPTNSLKLSWDNYSEETNTTKGLTLLSHHSSHIYQNILSLQSF